MSNSKLVSCIPKSSWESQVLSLWWMRCVNCSLFLFVEVLFILFPGLLVTIPRWHVKRQARMLGKTCEMKWKRKQEFSSSSLFFWCIAFKSDEPKIEKRKQKKERKRREKIYVHLVTALKKKMKKKKLR